MKLGILLRNMGPQSEPVTLVACARAAEDAGLDSLWVSDHLAIPPDDAEGSGGRYLEPLATLAFLAAHTTRIGLGTAVLVLPYRPPLPTAKWVATIQELSGGRLLLGVGVGWMAPEFRALGLDRRRRGAAADETLAFLERCFAGDEVEANGQRFLFRPRPPRPPLFVGGAPPHALERAVRFGAGWMPMGGEPAALAPQIRALRERAADAEVAVLTSLPLGDPARARDRLAAFAEAGATRVVHGAGRTDEAGFRRAVEALSGLGGGRGSAVPRRASGPPLATAPGDPINGSSARPGRPLRSARRPARWRRKPSSRTPVPRARGGFDAGARRCATRRSLRMIHPDTELRRAGDEIGLGVFATRLIPRGTIVWVLDELDQRFSPDRVRALGPRYARLLECYGYLDAAGDRVLCWDLARWLNHSCAPNVLSTGWELDIAIRDIAEGEEITTDYGALNLERSFACHCGRPDCRRTVRATDFERLADVWDARVREAFPQVVAVPQPLRPWIPKWTPVGAASRRPERVPSIRMHHLSPEVVVPLRPAAGRRG